MGGNMDEWIEQFSRQTSEELRQQQRRAAGGQAGLPTSQEYIMAEDNPFLQVRGATMRHRHDDMQGLVMYLKYYQYIYICAT